MSECLCGVNYRDEQTAAISSGLELPLYLGLTDSTSKCAHIDRRIDQHLQMGSQIKTKPNRTVLIHEQQTQTSDALD